MFGTEINSRPFLQILSGIFLLALLFPGLRRSVANWIERFETSVSPGRLRGVLAAIALCYFFAALACKYSQFYTHQLAGADFWLLEDMLRWMAKGQPYVTRFTGHDVGPVQHGAVHAFLSMYLLVPLVWLFGSEFTALAMNPLALAAGGFAIGLAANRLTGSRILALVCTVAFLASAWTGRILMYDCHPEAFYPLLIVGAFVTLRNEFLSSRMRWILMLGAVTLLAGMKQDALFITFAIWLNAVCIGKLRPKAAVVSFATLMIVSLLMTGIIRQFRFGEFGVEHVLIGAQTFDVITPIAGSVALKGYQLNRVADLSGLANAFFTEHGGALNMAFDTLTYLVKPPFLMIALIAPWVWVSGLSAWILLVPLGLIYGIVGGFIAGLPIYHSAPVLGLIFVAVIADWQRHPERTKKWRYGVLLWLVAISFLHGSSGLFFFTPNDYSKNLAAEAKTLGSELSGVGIVSSRLLAYVDHEKVWSDRPDLPGGRDLPSSVAWVLFPRDNESVDFRTSDFASWKQKALASGEWSLREGQLVDLMVRVAQQEVSK